ncbi:MAG: hypothetical protein U0992_24990 [Planctomycetaceae bacterium]
MGLFSGRVWTSSASGSDAIRVIAARWMGVPAQARDDDAPGEGLIAAEDRQLIEPRVRGLHGLTPQDIADGECRPKQPGNAGVAGVNDFPARSGRKSPAGRKRVPLEAKSKKLAERI